QGGQHRADAAAGGGCRPADRAAKKKKRMNARIAAVLVVLLAIIGGGALYYYQQERSRQPANAGALGQPLLKDLKVAEIASIRIVAPKATLTLQRKDEGWVIAERDGFPADLGKVRGFVLQALGLKVGQSEPIGE